MTNEPMLSVEREFQEVIYDLLASPQHHTRPEYIAAYEKLRALLDKPVVESQYDGMTQDQAQAVSDGVDEILHGKPAAQHQGDPVACMPVDRCYDVRAKMIIAFNETKKAGGDLDDALDAAYKSALRYSPNPMTSEQPVPVAVVMPERKPQRITDEYARGWNDYDAEYKRLNGVRP